MSSTNRRADPFDLDFDRDMPLTAADLEALARARDLRPLTTAAYLEWLTLMWRADGEPHRGNTDSDEPFTL
ncbi:MAG TPA: hypothetical protein VND45_05425 [Thermoanaerobaculia bacterium]|jgi:hypothetical protein|nr:hypothetical protein [Thermoanaerobaculia bacterium]